MEAALDNASKAQSRFDSVCAGMHEALDDEEIADSASNWVLFVRAAHPARILGIDQS